MRYPTSVIIETKKFLTNNGWAYNIYCGLTVLWAYCGACQKYTHQTPYTKRYDYKYVCNTCQSHATKVFHKELV